MNTTSVFRAYGQAWTILFSRRFRWFLLFPVILLVLLIVGGSLLVSTAESHFYPLLEARVNSWTESVTWLQWAGNVSGIALKIVLRLLYFFLFATFGGYLVLVIMSPIFSWLSEKTERELTGISHPYTAARFFSETFRGLWISVRNMVLQLLITSVLFLWSFVPGIGLLGPILMFLTSAYFYGYSFLCYATERKGMRISENTRYMNHRIGFVTITATGAVFAAALLVPCVQIFVCSFISLLAVIAATIIVQSSESEAGGR